ncbi:Protein kinase C and casein kinase substrate, variant 2 [Dermatophagoides farinae]|uniref:Protein kinase C and casein kinase substrate, variant 2 n=1 Tax=Dermatophagoides farinae TaxID=6954 RepID=A0A922IAJ2_DERFA|nr:protein kinase C and casein kinase substrate in neurons protein 1-like isoform X2 [Dermatophagoides farinae]KAH9527248.1 Protein kinase C and casein kinase substrate, variant 2 [Dermatophagoides farinae]
MSHHSDEAIPSATSDSFWEPGNYKKTTKRTEDGHKLCNDLMTLVKERSEIEYAYGKNLRQWAKKWEEIIVKGPEYGTTESAWKGVLGEAEKRYDLHMKIKNDLEKDAIAKIRNWQKDNYHKNVMHIKEKKEFDEAFKKAQKPWAKLLSKVNKCKQDYFNACKNERSITNQERNASGDTSLSPDQVKKLQDRAQKAKDEVQKTREKYEQSLKEISNTNSRYIEDMEAVFDRCQEFEDKRLKFFKEILFTIHNCLNLPNMPELATIYEEFRHTIQNADASKDLKYWSNTYGVGMAMNWPQFEEYNHELASISKKDKKNINNGYNNGDNVVLSNYQTEYYSDNNKIDQSCNNNGNLNNNNNNTTAKRINTTNGKNDPENPFEDDHEDWEDYSTEALVDNGEPGVLVKALYDYEGAESDELSFKQGDIFEKLEDEDDQGWCKGRKDGRVGLYPANYIEVLSTNAS